MRYLFLCSICIILCGCRTFTNTQLLKEQIKYFNCGYVYGHTSGWKDGEKIGNATGHIEELLYQTNKLLGQ